jgi:purine catabolism regulator
MLTVRNLLADLDVRVLAGEAGLDLPVRWVHISELLDPTPWLSGGEVLLTTGMQLDTPARQREFLARLADHQLAGLGFGTGFRHERVPEALLELAQEREFPVFEVPYELPFIALTEAAFTQLAGEQYAVLRRALVAHERLERIVLSERGLPALAATLASLVGAAVVVFGPRGEVLVRHDYRRELEEGELAEIGLALRERADRREARQFAPGAGGERRGLALPVAADGAPGDAGAVPEAWLVALKEAGPLSEFDRLTLRQAVTIIALELLRRRVAGETERRLAGDVLAGVLSGELSGPELCRRLAPFGCTERVAAIVIPRPAAGRPAAGRPAAGRPGAGRPATGRPATGRPAAARGAPAGTEAALRCALREEGLDGLVASAGALTCALVDAPAGEDELFARAERVAAALERELGPVPIGVGRAVAAAEARRSFHEARCALEAAGLGGASGAQAAAAGNGAGHARRAGARVATYRDLGAFQLLLALQDDEALRLYCDSILGPIEASEGAYGGELMRSLEAFIEENGQWERAAKRLYCHRHTLRYRIRRIEQLTGRELASARDRIEFWLAIRGRELVS